MSVVSETLPAGWTMATIGALVGQGGVFADGDWIESKDQDPVGDVRLIQLADIGDGTYVNRSSRFLTSETAERLRCTFLEAGDVLIARMPDPLGRACIFPGDRKHSVTAVDVCIVRTGQLGVNHRWLMWFVNTPPFRASIEALQSGTTRKRISRGNLATIPLPVPPLPEQHRIVAEIETQLTRLDAAVAALERSRANLRRYRAAVLKAACEGRLVPTEAELARAEGRGYESACALLERMGQGRSELAEDQRRSSNLPEGWAWTSAGTIGAIQGGIQKQPKRAPKENAYPFLRVANVPRGRLDLREVHRVELFGNELEKLRLMRGDLLIVEGNGSPTEIGRMAIWNDEVKDCVHQNHLIRVRLLGSISPKYIESYWNSPDGSNAVMQVASSTSGLHTLSVGKISRLHVPLPPLAEQHRIVAEVERQLSVIEEMERAVAHGLKRAVKLRQAILRKAFAGELVPQDPNDEPASVLLERIREEQAMTGAPTARRRRTRRSEQMPLI